MEEAGARSQEASTTQHARRETTAAREERARSRSAYRGSDDAEALQVAKRKFERVLSGPVWRGPAEELRSGQRLVRYLSDHSALISTGPGPNSLVESILPMRSTDETGHPAPIDLTLERHGNGVKPKNAAGTLLPDRLAEGLTFPKSHIHLGVAGIDSSVRAQSVDGKLFYADVARDTDLIVAPTPTGVRTFHQLRSDESPEDQALTLKLPPGARLHALSGGVGVEVLDAHAKPIMGISAPSAVDADGQPVPTSYEVRGDTIILHVAHHQGDWMYPILLDPAVTDDYAPGYYYPGGPYTANWSGWDPNPDGSSGRIVPDADSTVNYKLYLRATANIQHYLNEYRFWSAYSIRQSFIWKTFWDMDFAAGWADGHPEGPYQTRLGMGILNASGTAWEGQSGFNPLVESAPVDYNQFETCVASCTNPPATWPAGNSVRFYLQAQRDFVSTYYPRAGLFEGQIYRSDTNDPAITGGTDPLADGQWHPENTTSSFTLSAHDDGLGVKTITLVRPNAFDVHTASPCSGTWQSQCPADASSIFSYNTNAVTEGEGTYYRSTSDIIDRYDSNNHPYTVKVDRSAPSIDSVSGSLWDHRDQTTDHSSERLYYPSYTLHADASDRYSGVQEVHVQVDGQTKATTTQSSGADGAPLALDWTFNTDDYTEGSHTVSVTATDRVAAQAGSPAQHTATQSFTVRVSRHSDIYHATEYDGDPTAGGTALAEHWAQTNTNNSRYQTAEEITTRDDEPCDASQPSGNRCGVVRSRTVGGADGSATTDNYTTTKGASTADDRLPDASSLVGPDYSNLGSPTSTGPIAGALSAWQHAPPGHGDTFAYYEDDSTDTVDGAPDTHTTRRLWLDAATNLPLHEQLVSGDTVESDTYYDYDPTRYHASDLAADFFAVGAPSNLGQRTDENLATDPAPETDTTPAPTTDDPVLAHDTDFRAAFGLNTDPAYVASLLDDPVAQAGVADYGVPLSPSELATLRHRDALDEAAQQADDYGLAHASDYAGTWIDQQHGVVYVAFTQNLATHTVDLVNSFPYPTELRVVPALHTRDDLDALQARITDDSDRLVAQGLDVTSITTDEATNQVDVGATNPSAVWQAQLVATYGPAVNLVHEDPIQEQSADSDPIDRSLRRGAAAGMLITNHQTRRSCTGAFVLHRTNGTRGTYQITAGHCGRPRQGDSWSHGHNPFNPPASRYQGLGRTARNLFDFGTHGRTMADALAIQIKHAKGTNQLITNHGKIVHVKGIVQKFVSGYLACFSGYASTRYYTHPPHYRSATCGTLTRRTSVYIHGHKLVNQYRISHGSSCPGDSGGPVWMRVSGAIAAVGTVSAGGAPTSTDPKNPHSRCGAATWVSPITASIDGFKSAGLTFNPPGLTSRHPTVGVEPIATFSKAESGNVTQEVNGIVAAHAHWARVLISWAGLQPNRGFSADDRAQPNFIDNGGSSASHGSSIDQDFLGQVDSVVRALTAHGIRIIIDVGDAPLWGNGHSADTQHPPTSTADQAAYRDFYVWLAQHYNQRTPSADYHDLVHTYEIWNEENSDTFWPAGPNQPARDPGAYARMLVAVYQPLHVADPGATVLFGGMTDGIDASKTTDSTYLQQVYDRLPPGSYFDGVGEHVYPPGDPTHCDRNSSDVCRLDDVYAVMNNPAHNDGAKKLWITETGYASCASGNPCYGVGTSNQFNYLPALFDELGKKRYIDTAIWYTYRDVTDPDNQFQDSTGLVYHNFNPKPALSAFSDYAAAP
jgi:hypothetical protein